jgi:hypothetical protein
VPCSAASVRRLAGKITASTRKTIHSFYWVSQV